MFKMLCGCISKNTVEDIKPKIEISEKEFEEALNAINPVKSVNFIPVPDSNIIPSDLDIISTVCTISDSDSVVAIVGDSCSVIYSAEQSLENPSENPPENKKRLKSSSKYLSGKSVSYFYLSINRYYFIKNKFTEDKSFFGKFITINKSKKTCAVFEISGEGAKNFDINEYIFYRAIPKHK
jgi:hypothetical protein